jgi:hypothetical protein
LALLPPVSYSILQRALQELGANIGRVTAAINMAGLNVARHIVSAINP